MISKQLHHLNAVRLRLALVLLMALLVVGSGAGFWYFRSQLSHYASQVNADNAAASVSNQDIIQLQKLKTELEQDQVAITRAQNIVADSHRYQYQTQIIDDLTSYAKKAGVKITGFTFDSSNTSSGTTTSSTSAVPTTTSPTAAAPTAGTPAGLKTTAATISIESPAPYQNVMNFLYAIELNLTKMNITSVSMTAAPKGQVSINPIGIEVYTR